jgi:CDP-diacylglycerol pyrophosphatase
MPRRAFRPALLSLIALLALGRTASAADPDALWKIVNDKCAPNEREYGEPAPCALVDLSGGVERGYAVLKDLVGDTQYLLIPTAKITGIEDPALLAAGTANYFAAAWRERHFTETAAKRDLPREAISLAVNSIFARSQNQLHIHIDCIRAEVRDAVRRQIAAIGDTWMPLPEPLAGHRYRAIAVTGDGLDGFDPFPRLADGVPGAREAMGKETLVVIGATLAGGTPGFVVLSDRVDAATGDRGAGEDLQDHLCALARP